MFRHKTGQALKDLVESKGVDEVMIIRNMLESKKIKP